MKHISINQRTALIILVVLLGIAVVGMAVWAVLGFPTAQYRNMTVQATMVSADGTAGEPFPLTANWKASDTFSFRISKTEDFPYELEWENHSRDLRPDLPYLVTSGLLFSFEGNCYTSAVLAIDIDNGCFMLYWPEEDRCLVASTDENAATQQILDHFSDFVTDYINP